MSNVFNHAIRYEWLENNPIRLVRQSAKRERLPEVLDVGEISSLLTELQYPYKAMMFLAAATGLRASELLGLQWQDVDFDLLQINLSRGVVHEVIGKLKTEASQKPIPLDPDLASALLEWRYLSPFNQQSDWLFASAEKKGRQPYWPENLLRRYIRPAAARCGISKRIGWHTFRHSYATQLNANGEGEGDARVPAARQQSDHARYLHSGAYVSKEAGTNKSCQHDLAETCCRGAGGAA
jgi:integrase